MASIDTGHAGDVDAVLDLQQAAGNRAVVQLLAGLPSGTPRPVQRRPSIPGPDHDEAASSIDPGVLVLKPDDSGKPADQMEWDELEDAIDENESIVRSATQSTPDVRRRRARLVELYAAQQKLGSKAAAGAQGKAPAPRPAKARGRKRPPPVMPPKPATLTRGSLDWANTPGPVARRELSLVVAYLAANPPKADREILLLELPNIERAAGSARAEKQQARHIEQVTEALSPKTGSDQDKFDEILRRLQYAERDTTEEDTWLVHYENRVLPLSTAELAAVRERVGKGLMEAAKKISRFVYDVEGAWEERTQHNRSHSRTHKLVKFATGADDIPRSDIDNMLRNSRFYTSRIRERATSAQLVEAGNDLAVFDRNARYYAEKVGNWESELMRGAGRWVLGLTILKEALSIMAGFGAARLAALAGGGSTIATFKAGAKIATMTTTTGLLAGGVSAEATGGDWKKGSRAGGGAGFGVGAGALTAGVGKIASVGDAAKASTLGGKALAVTKAAGLETAAGVATSTTQAAIEGGDLGDAALGALVSNPISSLGGGAVDKLAKSKATATLGKTVVGGTAGGAGALAVGGDVRTGALVGAGGGMYGGLASPAPDAGPSGTAPADESIVKPSADALPAAAGTMTAGTPGPTARRPRAVPPPIPEAALSGRAGAGAGARGGFSETGPAEPDAGAKRPGTPDFESEGATQPDAKPAGAFADEAATDPDVDPAGARVGQDGDEAAAPRSGDEEEYGRPAELDDPDIEPEMKPPRDWDHQLVIQLKESTSRFESFKAFLRTFNMDRSREVGMYRNTETGEYIVIQGEQRKVGMVPLAADMPQRWKQILENHSKVGRWVLVAHTHPRGTPFPSGPKGDFSAVVREARLNRQSRESEIFYPTMDGQLRKTTFGFDIDSDTPYWFKPDGVDQPYRFKTLEDYLAFVGIKEEVPLWFPRGKADDAWFRVNQGAKQGDEQGTSD